MIYTDQYVKISYENVFFKYSKMFNINLNKENIDNENSKIKFICEEKK